MYKGLVCSREVRLAPGTECWLLGCVCVQVRNRSVGAAPVTFLPKLSFVHILWFQGSGYKGQELWKLPLPLHAPPRCTDESLREEADTKWIQVKMQSWSTGGQLDLTVLNSYHLSLMVWNQFWADQDADYGILCSNLKNLLLDLNHSSASIQSWKLSLLNQNSIFNSRPCIQVILVKGEENIPILKAVIFHSFGM